jgi:predicted DNA-binding transcriptional regulator AlpA
MSLNTVSELKLLRLKDVLKIIPISKATWYLMQKECNAPQPIRLGPKIVAWRESDILHWVEAQAKKNWQT